MNKCSVCGNATFKDVCVEQVFNVEGRMFLIEDVPASVCERCGEATFSRETTEHVRKLMHGDMRPKKHVNLDVLEYA